MVEGPPTAGADPGADPGFVRRLQRASEIAGVAISVLGVVVVAGWFAGLAVVTSLAPGLADMRFNTATGLVLVVVTTLLSGAMVWVIGASLRHVDLRRAGAEEASRRADAARASLEQALALLGRSEERLRRILETAGDAFISVDERGLVEAWNRAAETAFGWSAEQALGRPLDQLIVPPSLRAAHRAGLARIIAGGPSRILDRTVELTALHRDGSEVPVELTVWATHDDGRWAFNALVRDISVRKATEASTHLLAAVVESSKHAMLTIDPHGTVVSWNSGAEHLYGYRADEMIGRNAASVLARPGDEADREGERRRLGQGESTTGEVELIRADGCTITVSVTSSPILDADGCLVAVSSISRDITDEKETKRALAASEERYRSLADTATDLVTRISPATGTFVYVSPSVEAILGWTPEELVGRRYADIVDPATVSNARIDREVISTVGTHTRNGIRVRRRDGSWAWCDSTSRTVVDPTSGELEIRSSTRDVTARVEAERELAASEERFRLTQLHSPIGLAVVGLDGRWLLVNPALCEILGRTEEALLQLTFQDLSHPDDLEADLSLMEQTLRGEIPNYQTEKRYFRGDGQLVWVLLSVALVRDSGEPVHLIAQLLDITARKRDQEALDRASTRLAVVNDELVEVGRVKDHVLAVTNHELRTPLSSIVGFSDVLATDWADLSDAQRLDFVERIRQSGWRMTKLVDDFLFAVELASGTLKIEVIAAELGPVLDAALARAGATRAGISVDCPDGLRVNADPDRLAQILTNYLTNASKFGGAPVAMEAVEADGFVEIRVKDRGPGVSPEFVSSIFERFNPASRGTDFTVRGTGLGLAIARGLAHAQGGEAWYEPNQVHGAIFGVRIPVSC